MAAIPGAARHARPDPDAVPRRAERADQRRGRQRAGGALGLCHLLHARHVPHRRRQARAVPDVGRHRRRLGRAATPTASTRSISSRRRTIPVEFLEAGYPVRLRAYGILDLCGPDGFAAAAASCANTRSWPRRRCWRCASTASKIRPGAWPAAWPAAPAASWSIRARTRARAPAAVRWQPLKRGDILRIETGGGGGHGHPFDRPAEKVLEDVLGGFVTVTRRAALRRRHRRRQDRSGRHRLPASAGRPGVPSQWLCRQPWLTPPSPSPSISAAPSPTSPCTSRERPGLARQDAERAERPLAGFPDRRSPRLEEAGHARRRSIACCTAPPSPPT